MNIDTNFVSINGVLSKKIKDYHILMSIRNSGAKNLIRVWGLDDEVITGQRVNIVGELDVNPLYSGTEKMVLGVKAKAIFPMKGRNENDAESYVRVQGEIIPKNKLRLTPITKNWILNLLIRLDDGTDVPVVVWNRLAKEGVTGYDVGDRIRVAGRLNSRIYQKIFDEKVVDRLTTEVNAYQVTKKTKKK